MKITDGIKEMDKSNMIPEARYMWEVDEVKEIESKKDGKKYELAECKMLDAPEEALKGRTISFFIVNVAQSDVTGLSTLLKAAKLLGVPEDENGNQDTMTSLKGVQFPGDIVHEADKKNPGVLKNVLYPHVDLDWVESL